MTKSLRVCAMLAAVLSLLPMLSGCESGQGSRAGHSGAAPAAIEAADRPDLEPDQLMAIADRGLIRARGITAQLLVSNATEDGNRDQAAREAYIEAARHYLAFADRVGYGDDVVNAKLHAAEALTMSGRADEAIDMLKQLIPAATTTDAAQAEGLYWLGIAYLKVGDTLNGDLSHQRLAYEHPDSPWAEWAHVGGAPAGIPTPDDVEPDTRSIPAARSL